VDDAEDDDEDGVPDGNIDGNVAGPVVDVDVDGAVVDPCAACSNFFATSVTCCTGLRNFASFASAADAVSGAC
jgi:hypothetical protein